MVLILMLELMVPTTLARGLLMLSLRQRLMLSMVPMDILHILLPMLMDMLLLLILMDTQDILDTLDTLMLPMVLMPMVPTLTSDRKKLFFLQKTEFLPQHQVKNNNVFQLKYFTHSQ